MREEPADSTKPIEFFRVPVRRMFKTEVAAQYLGLHPQTLRRLTDEGKLKALNMDGKRVYTIEELDRYIGSLPERYHGAGERPEASNGERNGIQESKGSEDSEGEQKTQSGALAC